MRYRSGGDDVDDLAVVTDAELHAAVGQREQGVILAHADVLARVEVGATLMLPATTASPPNFLTPRY